ncbi:MAG: 2-oxoglutarate dehydrogenase, E2 component, dihydrolipoamide succinyltransferase [Actinomycetota bacterium]
MATKVEMPQMGESVVEGTILNWLKSEGDDVQVDDPLVEVSTDKVDTEIPSPVAGKLVKILVQEGDTVEVGTALAEIDESGSGAATTAEPKAEERKAEAEPIEEPREEQPAAESEPDKAPPAPEEEEPAAAAASAAPAGQVLSPIVRRLAREHDVDLSQVRGTGAGGRVTRDDVLAFVERPGGNGDRKGAAVSGDGRAAAAAAERVAPPPTRAAGGERTEAQPLTHIRKRIAEHMRKSLDTSARAWNAIEVDMEPIARLRAEVGDAFRKREGFSLTYLPFIGRAVCDALLAHPEANASVSEDLSEATYHHYVNLGIAVATDYGLIVPVIKGAEALNVVGLARAIRDLGERARDKKLNPDEVGGSTFTITNPGPFGSFMSLPVINQPNVAILSTELVEKRVVVVDDMIGVRHRTFLSLSWDHRLLDGADAMRFLARLKENLETWDFSHEL